MGENERLHGDENYVAEQERVAAEEAVQAGGGPVNDEVEESERALAEAGQSESEGFEVAEDELIENVTHEADYAPDPVDLAGEPEETLPGEYGEADTKQPKDL